MRKSIFTFHRDEEPVAELHLELREAGSVSGWQWHGDPGVKKAMKRLPNNSWSLYDGWYCDILRAAERAGLTFTERHEGGSDLPMD
jgi:hypothetical protein